MATRSRTRVGDGNDRPGVGDLSYAEAGIELDRIIEEFETGVVDVDRLVEQLERATDIVDELDRRLRRTRLQVEELVPRLEAIGRRDESNPTRRPRTTMFPASGTTSRTTTSRTKMLPPRTSGWRPRPARGRKASRAACSDPSVDLAVLPLPVGRPQLALEDLARRVAGEDLDEVDRRRALVVGQALAGGGDDLGRQLRVILSGAHRPGAGTTTAFTVSPHCRWARR